MQGLSPKENRDIPPLDYPLVLAMKGAFPQLSISINGGIGNLDEVEGFLAKGLDGVMVGRAAYQTPWDILGDADRRIFGADNPCDTPHDAVAEMIPCIEAHLTEGGRLHSVTRHMLGLFAGRPGARVWRRVLTEGAHRDGAGVDLIDEALSAVLSCQAA